MTSTATLNNVDPIATHVGPWTEDDYFALPEMELQRVELIDGELIVTPRGDNRHQRLEFRLCRELERLLPVDIEAVSEPNLRLRQGRIVVPDVAVTTNLGDWVIVEASDITLVAEVVSPFGKARDKIFKPALYAEAGIPWYLLVERDPKLELTLFRRQGGAYTKHAAVGEGAVLDLPDLCSIEVDALLRRR